MPIPLIRRIEGLIVPPRMGANAWFKDRTLDIFVRVTKRTVDGRSLVDTIDLAYIIARRPGNGAFTKLLGEVEQLAVQHKRVVYIENVIEPRFLSFLTRRGYTVIPDTSPPCAFKAEFEHVPAEA